MTAPPDECLTLHLPNVCPHCHHRISRGFSHIRGPILEGVELDECEEFGSWVMSVREQYRMIFSKMIDSMISKAGQDGFGTDIVSFGTRLTMLDPLDEVAQRILIRMLWKKGQREAAIIQYESFRKRLMHDIGVSPEQETRTLFEQIRTGQLAQEFRIEPSSASPPAESSARLERRLSTVLFIDVFPEWRDEEANAPETGERVEQIFQKGMDLMVRSGGVPYRSHGRGFLIYFGLQEKSEGTARIAARAALEFRDLVALEPSIRFRGGMNAGPVVTGSGQESPDPGGAVSRVAIALAMLAEPEEILISESVSRLLKEEFAFDCAGNVTVLGHRMERRRLLALSQKGHLDKTDRMPSVGRDEERTLFSEKWRKNKGGILLLEGPPGIGKSHLVRCFAAHARKTGGVIRGLECFPQYTDTPFFPVNRLMKEMIEIPETIGPEEAYRRIHVYLDGFGLSGKESSAAMGYFLSLPPENRGTLWEEPGPVLTERATDLILAILRHRLKESRLLLVIDDLHWSDPSTQSLLRRLFLDREILFRVFVVLAARTDAVPEWVRHLPGLIRMELSPLTNEESQTFIRSFMKEGVSLEEAVIGRVVEVSEGVPLFIKELTQSLIDSPSRGDGRSEDRLPETIQEVLSSQLDMHAQWRPLLQRASVIGRSVPMDLFRQISRVTEEDFCLFLKNASSTGFIDCVENTSGSFLTFRHALIRDVAYQSLPHRERKRIHREVASAILSCFPDQAQSNPEVVAQHHEQAGERESAVIWYEAAARKTLEQGSFLESEKQVRNALRLVALSPQEPSRAMIEVRLLLFLGNLLVELYGHGSREAREVHQKALSLCQSGQPVSEELFRAMCSLCVSLVGSGDIKGGRVVTESLRAIVGAIDEPAFLFSFCYADANLSFWEGRFTKALEQMDQCIGLYQIHEKEWETDFRMKDTLLQVGIFRSWALWFSGNPLEACGQLETSFHQATSTEQQGLLLSFGCGLYRYLRLPEKVLELSDKLLGATQSHRTKGWIPAERAFRGWVMAMGGQVEGIPLILQGLALSRRAHRVAENVYLSLLAEAYLSLGDRRRARGVIDSALRFSRKWGTRFSDAELWRLKGETELADGNVDEAERCLMRALSISREQGARLPELRTVMSLARGMRIQGKKTSPELFQSLADLLSPGLWDFPDIVEAREMMRECFGGQG